MIANTIVKAPKDIPHSCPRCLKKRLAAEAKRGFGDSLPPVGVMFRAPQSRLEDGLGHESRQCDNCGHTMKRVP